MRKLLHEPSCIQPDSGAARLGRGNGCLWRAGSRNLSADQKPTNRRADRPGGVAQAFCGGDRIIASILGRGGGLLDDRERLRLAIFFAKTQMGWTVAKRPKLVCDPIDE